MAGAGLLLGAPAYGLSPGDLVVVYNRTMPASQEVAQYYARQRQVPPENLLGLDLPQGESMSWPDFEAKLAAPVREFIRGWLRPERPPVLLLVYGVPFKLPEAAKGDDVGRFLEMARGQRQACQARVGELLEDLDRLLSREPQPTAAAPENFAEKSLAEVMHQVRTTFSRGVEYLKHIPKTTDGQVKYHQVYAWLSQLAGPALTLQALPPANGQPDKPGEAVHSEPQEIPLPPQVRQIWVELNFWGVTPDKAAQQAEAVRQVAGMAAELNFWVEAAKLYTEWHTAAAVDNELALALVPEHQRPRWLPNPFQPAFDRMPGIQAVRRRTLMVARLDAPAPALARRLVDDAIQAEAAGLQGVCYLDARGLKGDNSAKPGSYAWFDQHLVQLAQVLKSRSNWPVVLDERPELFPPGACPNAALYCGWYSLGKYVPAFRWQKGAVGYHVASSEATTLRTPNSAVWCKRMLEEGAAATLGPVAEPYLAAFPLPDQFFPLLMTGAHPLVEVYFRTLPHLSWRMILLGDPLYNPFKKRPAITASPDSRLPSKK
jgi:uncharacterized protein (TIGR03790 family)